MNLSLIRDVISYANEKKLPASLISIDQIKAFDRVNWTFLFNILKKFGYGTTFINSIKTIYNNIKSRTKVNGFLSEPFNLERGVRQGCSISMPLYVLVAEIFAIYVKQKKSIKGIFLLTKEHKLSQYADDANFFLLGLKSITALDDAIQLYEAASGAKINPGKCKGLWLGQYKNNEDTPLNYTWNSERIKLLGITFGNPGVNTDKENWYDKLSKILQTIQLWTNLHLSYKGKKIIINQLFLSKLWYAAQITPVPKGFTKKLDDYIYQFLWDNKKTTTKKVTTQLTIPQGGLGIINTSIQIQALVLQWIVKLFKPHTHGPWTQFFEFNLNKIHRNHQGKYSLLTFINNIDFDPRNSLPLFYKQLITAWIALTKNIRSPPTTIEGVLSEPLFQNTLVKSRSTSQNPFPALPKTPSWASNHIIQIGDICHTFKPGFVNHEMVCKITETPIQESEYTKLIDTIRHDWQRLVNNNTQSTDYLKYTPTMLDKNQKPISINKLNTKLTYNIIIQSQRENTECKFKTWPQKYTLGNITATDW